MLAPGHQTRDLFRQICLHSKNEDDLSRCFLNTLKRFALISVSIWEHKGKGGRQGAEIQRELGAGSELRGAWQVPTFCHTMGRILACGSRPCSQIKDFKLLK